MAEPSHAMAEPSHAMATVYTPLDITSSSNEKEMKAMIILNNGPSMRGLERVLVESWSSFNMHVCTDGGANSLYNSISDEQRNLYIPEVIIGDFDSINESILAYYKSKGSNIIIVPDQDNTDFGKALQYLSSHKFSIVYVFNCLWGRFDQVIGNIHQLYCINITAVYIVTEDTIIFTLKPGDNMIYIKRGLEEGHCGVFPLGDACKECWTTGLQWNLAGQEMSFNGLISVCNLLAPVTHSEDYVVTVKCTSTLCFSLSHKLLK